MKPRGIEELIIEDGLYNSNSGDISRMKMYLSEFKKLKRIEIGNNCFKNVREFVVDGLESLESVKIGRNCFRISDKERNDGVCRIMNCPTLRQLEIGHYSFEDFQSFELSNLNSIQSIKFGWKCFEYADFSLKGEWKERMKWKKCNLNDNDNENENENDVLDLPSLEIVSFGGFSFTNCHLAVFESIW